jgi:MFS family permease
MARVKIPRTVWTLGFVSLFMDVSSEMVHSLLPLFLVTVLGASAIRVGFIEGIAESTAMIVKIFSGALSDWMRNRKVLALIGYSLGAATKPLFALAPSIAWVFTARFIDRIGKGIRGAPRDALIADVTPPEIRGAAYGLRQSLDTVGALLGPILAMVLMKAMDGNFRGIFWIAAIPGFLAVILLAVFVREPKAQQHKVPLSKEHQPAIKEVAKPFRNPIDRQAIGQLKQGFWLVVLFGALLSLARFSEAFLILRGPSSGILPENAPIIMVIMNLVYVLTAYPVGHLSDKLGRSGLLAAGIGTLVVSDLVLAISHSPWQVMLGATLWGLQMGLTQGVLSAMVADSAPASLRGTAFGLFNLAAGLATLLASVIAGITWEKFGPYATFVTGAGFAAGALVLFTLMHTRMRVD